MRVRTACGAASNVNLGKCPFFFFGFVNIKLKGIFVPLLIRTSTEAECIFHEMLHKWDITKNIQMPCPLCHRLFTKNSLRCHLRVHTNDRIFKCAECTSTFTRKSNLRDHIIRVHTTQGSRKNALGNEPLGKPFYCEICSRTFYKRYVQMLLPCSNKFKSVV